MALSAFQIARWGMLEAGNSPTGCSVTLGTITAEEAQVPIFGGMASATVENFARRTFVELAGNSNPQPSFHRFDCGEASSVHRCRVSESSNANSGEFYVVHRDRPNIRDLMLDMTGGALPDTGVKSGRLAAEQLFGVGMTSDAFCVSHP